MKFKKIQYLQTVSHYLQRAFNAPGGPRNPGNRQTRGKQDKAREQDKAGGQGKKKQVVETTCESHEKTSINNLLKTV